MKFDYFQSHIIRNQNTLRQYIAINNQKSKIVNNSEQNNEFDFFGTWSLDKVVLKSKNYDGDNWGGIMFYKHDYVGYEIEYNSQFFRLGNEKFFNPEYKLYDFIARDYNINGDFETLDFYDFIIDEEIKIDGLEKYEDIEDFPLVYFVVSFKEDYFIPIGSQCIVLNKDTMLIGVWGEVILAHRIE